MVPINVAFKEKEAAYILRHSECIALVGNKETLGVTKNVHRALPFLKWIISVDDRPHSSDILAFSTFKREDPQLFNQDGSGLQNLTDDWGSGNEINPALKW